MAKYKVAVLGPIPRDHIITHKNEVFEKYGCVTHTAIALSHLLGDEGVVFPVTHVRKKDQQAILDIFKPWRSLCGNADAARTSECQGNFHGRSEAVFRLTVGQSARWVYSAYGDSADAHKNPPVRRI